MPPKLVPTSSPASACANRAAPSNPAMTIKSPDQLNMRPVAKVGTRAAATQVIDRIKYGMIRNSQEAFSASTTSFNISRRRSR